MARKKGRKRTLTQKRENFCQKYIETGHGRESYKFAFSTKNMALASVDKEVQKLLKDPLVSRRLAQLRKLVTKDTLISTKSLLNELAIIAMFDPRKLYDEDGNLIPIPDLPDDVAKAIAGIDVVDSPDGEGGFRRVQKYKIYNKITAWDNIQKYLKLFEDAGKDRGDIKIDISVRKPATEEIPPEFLKEGE